MGKQEIYLVLIFLLAISGVYAYQWNSGTEFCFPSETGKCYILSNNINLNKTIIYPDALYLENLFLPKVYNVTGGSYINDFCFPSCNLTAPNSNTTIRFDAEDSSLVMSSLPSWTITEGQNVTITCSSNGNVTTTLYRDGIVITSPYSTTPSYGTYNFTCVLNDTSGRFTPVSTQNFLTVQSSGSGCTDTSTYAFQKTITPSGVLVNLNFTGLVESNYVKQDLSDVWVNSSIVPDAWTNFTSGSYLVVNITGVSSFVVKFGNYIGNQSYTNTSQSDNTTAMTSYQEINDYYILFFYEELNSTQQLPPSSNRTVSIFCSSGSSRFNLSSDNILVATNQRPERIRTTINYGSSQYYRDLLVRSDVETKRFYLTDALENTVVQTVITLIDLTGDFSSSTFKVKNYIENSLETITELNFDAENKVITYLVDGEAYQVYVDNGDEERSFGLFYADSSDTTKDLIVGELININRTQGNISYSLTKSGNVISFSYYDPSQETNNVSMYVYFENDTLVYFTSSINKSTVNFNFDVTSYGVNETYKVNIHIAHDYFGDNSYSFWSIFGAVTGALYSPHTLVTEFPNLFPMAGIIIIMGIPMLFGGFNSSMGAIVTVAIAALFVWWGWIGTTILMLVICGALAILNKINESRRQ